MAEKRMFSKTVVDSDTFLDMPLTTQALYFHLSMRADDEGFINSPKRIQRLVGCCDDDMKLLIAKKFVIVFESGVIVIRHWRLNNYLRSDRFVPTVFEEEKSKLTETKNGVYELGIPSGIPNDNQTVDTRYTQYRIEENSIDKSRIDESNNACARTRESEPAQKIIARYNEICKSLPKVTTISQDRKKLATARLKEYGEEKIIEVFEKAEQSSFLTGSNSNGWKANYDWLMKPTNFAKVIDDFYKESYVKRDFNTSIRKPLNAVKDPSKYDREE